MNRPILVVEDNDDDLFFLKRALNKAGVQRALRSVTTGQMAINYFQGVGNFSDRSLNPLPCIVLLDLKLPEVPGLEVLKWIRSRDEYRTIPVIILTSSSQDSDVDTAYRLGANSFLVKPPNIERLVEVVRVFNHYWLNLNRPPTVCLDDGGTDH